MEKIIETDIAIIGAGPGGYVAAIKAAKLGKKVIVIEKENNLGGICLNNGCIPTKALIHSTEFFSKLDELKMMGIDVKNYEFNLTKMKEWKESIVKKLNLGIDSLFKHHNIKIINGNAYFKNNNEIEIKNETDIKIIKFNYAIIATGSKAIEIKEFPFNNKRIINSDNLLEFENIPKKLAIIGGGYIGLEMATIFNRLGVEIHIIENQENILNFIDKDIIKIISSNMIKQGINIYTKTKAISFKEEKEIKLKLIENNHEKEIEIDKILVTVGREPNSKDLGLENINIDIDEKGFIIVDENFKTNEKNIFAIGDVIGNPMLAHKASYEAKIVIDKIFNKDIIKNKVIPSVIYTDPEIATVGLNENEARNKFEINVNKFNFYALGRALTLNKTQGFIKIISNKENNKILGVEIIGENASELIAQATFAIEMDATLEDISKTMHAHPTLSEIIMECAELGLNKSVHQK